MIDSSEATPIKLLTRHAFQASQISIFFFPETPDKTSKELKMNEEYDVIVLGTGLTVRNGENFVVWGVEATCNLLTSA